MQEIFRDDLSSSKDQSIRFWERSGQKLRPRSRKSKKRIFVITRSVFVQFTWNRRQNVHFSITYPLIWRQTWRWQRYALYRLVCMYVKVKVKVHRFQSWHHIMCSPGRQPVYVCYQLLSKTTEPNCAKFSGMISHHPRTNQLDFGSDQVKAQGQGHAGLKNYWTELHEVFRDDLSSSKDQLIRFWEQSG